MARKNQTPRTGQQYPVREKAGTVTRLIRGLNLLQLHDNRLERVDPAENRVDRASGIRRERNISVRDAYEIHLQRVYDRVNELAPYALEHVGRGDDPTAKLEVIRPLPQDRLFSRKLREWDNGRGFTRSEYLHGVQQKGANDRRFQVMDGDGFDGVRALVLPYIFGGKGDIDRRPRRRHNKRPEDMAIALDGSGRSWKGIYVPSHVEEGRPTEKLPVVGVIEDPKSGETTDHAIEQHNPVVFSDTRMVVDKIMFLIGVEKDVVSRLAPYVPGDYSTPEGYALQQYTDSDSEVYQRRYEPTFIRHNT